MEKYRNPRATEGESIFLCSFLNSVIIHMTTSVSRGLAILCIMFKMISFFIITLFSWLNVGLTFTSVSRRLTILCIMFKIIGFL